MSKTVTDVKDEFVKTMTENEEIDFFDVFGNATRELVNTCGMTLKDAAAQVAHWCVDEGYIAETVEADADEPNV